MAEKPTKGTVVSFGNTPQARDDNFVGLGTEDSGIIYLNVMANDLAGNGKSLWATDDGVSEGGDRPVDLLTQDAVNAEGATALGAKIWITADGRVAYQATAAMVESFQSLSVGQSITDSFTYAIQMGNGTLSWAKVNVTLAGTNDRPVVQNVSIAAVEDGQPVTGSFIGDDVDSDDDANSLTYNLTAEPAVGTLTKSGTSFTYAPGGNFQELAQGETQVLGFTYTATDKHGAVSDPASGSITVTGVNDAPSLKAGASELTEDGATVTVNLATLGADVDSDDDGGTLVYSTLDTPPGGSATVSGTTLSLSAGTDFQALALDETTSFTVKVQATDKHGATATNDISVKVTGVNDAPTLNAGALGASEDGAAVTLDLSSLGDDIDSDDDAGSLAYSLAGPAPQHGVATMSDTILSYAPGQAFQGLAQGETTAFMLDVAATDQHGASTVNTVTVTVTGRNDAPTLESGALAITEDGGPATLSLAMLGDDVDSDNDGSNLVYTTGAGLPQGTATVNATTLTVDPGAGYQYLAAGETRTFDLALKATDAHGLSQNNVVKVSVTGRNDAPTLGGDVAGGVTAMAGNQTLKLEQWTGYPGPYDEASLRSHASANKANYTVSTTVVDFTDDPGGFSGEIPGSMPWPAAAATGASGTTGINDQFIARVTGQISVPVTDTYTFRTFNDDGVYLRVNNQLIISDHSHHPEAAFTGNITLAPGVYPVELFFFEGGGEASLEFTVKNSAGSYGHVVSTQQLGDSGVLNFNDVDLIDTHTVTVAPVGTTLGAMSATMTQDSTNGGPGNVSWNYAVDNKAVVSLGAGQTRVETFTVTVSDNQGSSASQNVAVTITGINDGPTAVNDSNALTVAPASQVSTSTVKWVDWTEASPGIVKGAIDLGGGQKIDVTFNGAFQFTQTNGGTDYYTTPATLPGDFTLGTSTYTSAAVANRPTGTDIIALNPATTRTLSFSQPVDDLFFAVVSLNGNGYRFDQDFDILSYGRGFFGNGSAVKTALPDGRFELLSVNTPGHNELHGMIGIKGSVTTLTWDGLSNENWNGFTVGTYGKAQTAVATGNLLANDTDPDTGDTLSVATVNGQAIVGNSLTLTLPSGARVTVNKNGTYDYDENGAFAALSANQSASDSFSYTVKDSHGASSNVATVTLNITGINDAPKAVNDTISVAEEQAVSINVLGNDSDPDAGDALQLVGASGASHGTLALSGNNVVYTSHKDYNGTDAFTYTVRDAAGVTSTATVNVNVTGVADTYTLHNLAKNGSFEASTPNVYVSVGSLQGYWTVPNEWTMTGNGVDVVPGWQDADGNVSLDLNAFSLGGVKQAIPTVAGQQYSVSFMLSKNPGGGGQSFIDTVLVQAGANSAQYDFSAPNTGTSMMWQQKTFSFTGNGGSTELSFASLTPAVAGNGDVREGPALDEVVVVTNQVINGFVKGGPGGDVLNLGSLLGSIGAPHDASAFSGGFLTFQHTGGNTVVGIDANGGGDNYLVAATLVGVVLLPSDTGSFIL